MGFGFLGFGTLSALWQSILYETLKPYNPKQFDSIPKPACSSTSAV